ATVTVDSTPSAPEIMTPTVAVCTGSSGNTASGPEGATSYAWGITNGTIASGGGTETVTYTAGTTGHVTLSLTVTYGSTCSASNTKQVTIGAAPGVDAPGSV